MGDRWYYKSNFYQSSWRSRLTIECIRISSEYLGKQKHDIYNQICSSKTIRIDYWVGLLDHRIVPVRFTTIIRDRQVKSLMGYHSKCWEP